MISESSKSQFYLKIAASVILLAETAVIYYINKKQYAANIASLGEIGAYLYHFIRVAFYMAPVACVVFMIRAYLINPDKFKISLCKQKLNLKLLILNLAAFVASILMIIYDLRFYSNYEDHIIVFITVHILELVTLISIPFLIFNFPDLRILINENLSGPIKIVLMLTFLYVGYIDRIVSNYIGQNLIEPTIKLAQFFYQFTGGEIKIDHYNEKGRAVITGGSFFGEVAPGCAGYEGVSFIVLFMIIFYPYLRKAFNRIEFFLVLSVCVAVVFLMNSIRMAILMYVGEHISPEVAIGGFHTNFGMLTLVIVSIICMVSVWIKSNFDSSNKIQIEENHTLSKKFNDETVMIMPLVMLLSTSLITGIASSKFNWLYPVPIVFAAIACFPIRSKIYSFRPHRLYIPSLVGLIVFFIWIYLIPRDANYEVEFIENLNTYGQGVAVIWILFRILGSSLVVPVVEELAFRGALWDIIIEKLTIDISPNSKKIVSLLSTSLAFGYLHEDMVAATIAGISYGLLRFFYNNKSYPIIAHVTTNFLIALYVVAFKAWSYW